MLNPSMPNIPGMGAMTDTLDFVKNLWGGMNVPGMGLPGMVMPTLSVEEINKQISDLKAVETWLNVNMNMLRATIQALEVQSATISTLKSMGETLGAAVKSNTAAMNKPRSEEAAAPPPASAYSFSRPAAQPAPAPEVKPDPEPAPQPEPKTAAAPNPGAPLGNPAVWWNMLQDQFKQAVSNAMVAETPSAAPKASKATAAAPKVAKAAKKAAPRKPKVVAPKE